MGGPTFGFGSSLRSRHLGRCIETLIQQRIDIAVLGILSHDARATRHVREINRRSPSITSMSRMNRQRDPRQGSSVSGGQSRRGYTVDETIACLPGGPSGVRAVYLISAVMPRGTAPCADIWEKSSREIPRWL